MSLETDTDIQNRIARDAGGRVGRLRKELQEALEVWKDAEAGAEARRLLDAWKTATLESGLKIPGDLSHVPLDAVKQLREALDRSKRNPERYRKSDQTRADLNRTIVPAGRYKVVTRHLTLGRPFAYLSEFEASEIPADRQGALSNAIRDRKVVRVADQAAVA